MQANQKKNEMIFNQIELARSWTIEVAESISHEVVNVKPNGFKNTIHWQIGHILASTEYFLFELANDKNHLPENYTELFGSGTKPDDWEGDVPTIEQLVAQLKAQLVRMRGILAPQLTEKLVKPMHGFKTLADCAAFSVLHEVLHVGKIEEMERVIVNSRAKN